jgi:hypothetical protein
MGQDVRREIDALATANSDSTQWSLAQADVEMLALKWAIWAAQIDGQGSLADVRTRFDVFYSRIQTISTSPLFAGLREDPEVVAALGRINDFLSESVPVIDGGDAELAAALPDLAIRAEEIREDARYVTLHGVSRSLRARPTRSAEASRKRSRWCRCSRPRSSSSFFSCWAC